MRDLGEQSSKDGLNGDVIWIGYNLDVICKNVIWMSSINGAAVSVWLCRWILSGWMRVCPRIDSLGFS